jgi:hypothetical protein
VVVFELRKEAYSLPTQFPRRSVSTGHRTASSQVRSFRREIALAAFAAAQWAGRLITTDEETGEKSEP